MGQKRSLFRHLLVFILIIALAITPGCTSKGKDESSQTVVPEASSYVPAESSKAMDGGNAAPSSASDLEVSVTFLGKAFSGKYTGEIKDGKPSGEGTFKAGEFTYAGTFADGAFVTGSVTGFPYEMIVGGETFTGTLDGTITDGVLGGKVSFNTYQFTYEGSLSQGAPYGYGQVTKMPYTMTFMEQTTTGTYNGAVDGIVPSGKGEYAADSLTFKGSFLDGVPEDGEISGLILTLNVGESRITGTYNGQVTSGTLTGNGTFESDSFNFEGIFRGGVPGDGKMTTIPYTLVYNGISYPGTYTGPVIDMAPSGESGVFDAGPNADGYYLSFTGTFANGGLSDGTLKTNGYTTTFYSRANDGSNVHEPFDRMGTFEGPVVAGRGEGQVVFSAVNSAGTSYTLTGPMTGGVFNGEVTGVYHLGVGDLTVVKDFIMGDEFYETGADFLATWMINAQPDNMYSTIPIACYDLMNAYRTEFMFGEAHPNLSSLIDTSLTYDQYISDPASYAGKIIKISGLTVYGSEPGDQIVDDVTYFDVNGYMEGTTKAVWMTMFGTKDKLATFTFDPNSTVSVSGMPIFFMTEEGYTYVQILAFEIVNDAPPPAPAEGQ